MARITSSSQGNRPTGRRCLIIERHDWETGARTHQLQFPLKAAQDFFGPDTDDINISVRMFEQPSDSTPFLTKTLTISRRYGKSSTRRTNRIMEFGDIPSSFVFFEETDQSNIYDIWWEIDKAIVAVHFYPWQQAKNSQYGRGRLWQIIEAPVRRMITRI